MMIELRTIFICLSLLLLAACGSDEPGPVSITTVTGEKFQLSETFQRTCSVDDRGIYGTKTEKYVGNTLTFTVKTWGTVNTTCSGPPEVNEFFVAVVSASLDDATLTNWTDDLGDITDAPIAADGSGPLSNNEPVTVLTFTITSIASSAISVFRQGVGFKANYVYVVDDTVDPPILYESFQVIDSLATVGVDDIFTVVQ